jgi:hypothetical protein
MIATPTFSSHGLTFSHHSSILVGSNKGLPITFPLFAVLGLHIGFRFTAIRVRQPFPLFKGDLPESVATVPVYPAVY